MHVSSVTLKNFRGVPRLMMSFPKDVTVLVGANGAGKTTLLEAIATMLFPIADHFLAPKGRSAKFRAEDISNGQSTTDLEVATVLGGGPCKWSVQFQLRGTGITRPAWDEDELERALAEVDSRLAGRADWEIPIAVYYPTERAVLDIPLRIRTRHSFHQFEAWEGALGEGETRFRLFFEWFRDREDIENEQRARGDETPDIQLDAVRSAVEGLLEGYRHLKVQRVGLRMTIENPDGIEVSVDQLSAGEKGLLALAGDLARRLAIAGGGTKAQDVRGVVLIDEIELHLHPKWQRLAIPALTKAFPKCQFIVTTHSPQVISEIAPEKIFVLHRGPTGLAVEPALATEGKDSSSLLREIFGDPGRPKWMADDFDRLRQLIDAKEYGKARELLETISKHLGQNDPSVSAIAWDLRDAELSGETDSEGA